MNKYRNIKTEVDGILFDSKKESYRYLELKCLERAGELTHLELQPKFVFFVPGKVKDKKIFTYKADFKYYLKGSDKTVIEDVKGIKTPVYKLKKKLIEALYNIEIIEI